MIGEYWGPDPLQPADGGGGQCDGTYEVLDVAVEAGGEATPVFEAAEHALDDVALFVDGAITVVLDLAGGIATSVPRASSHSHRARLS